MFCTVSGKISGDIMKTVKFIRYPGGKQRLLKFILPYLPSVNSIKGRFVEPFVGGGAVFFALNPSSALLADINPVLIDLYRGLRNHPSKVWEIFMQFPKTRLAYYKIRNSSGKLDLPARAAKTLYLNRTCFKGMWRENSRGQFNVGYGGQDRRWVINQESLIAVSKFLKKAELKVNDFEETIESCDHNDFLFIDPPYLPGERELIQNHYIYYRFTYDEHRRLATALKKASKRKVKWALTISSHNDIIRLYNNNYSIPLLKGTGKRPGQMVRNSGEVLICNYREAPP
jgi:DNA adenine methylase